jgi:hypothetical protein
MSTLRCASKFRRGMDELAGDLGAEDLVAAQIDRIPAGPRRDLHTRQPHAALGEW